MSPSPQSHWPEQSISQQSECVFRPAILHITADYPDLNKPVTTLAVKNFIAANGDADHFIISLNRTALPWRWRVTEGGGNGDPRVVSIRYIGLPFGILLSGSMYVAARSIRKIVTKQAVRFDVIHAHKFSFEGIAAYWLSKWSGKPFVCSLRGGTDGRVLRAKPLYFFLYRRMSARAARLYYVSAWFRSEMRRRFAVCPSKERLLPNFVHMQPATEKNFRRNSFLSVMSFSQPRQKGLHVLLPAFKDVLANQADATLDLVGIFATPERVRRVQALIDRYELSQSVRIVGTLAHEELLTRLGGYAGFVLPSRGEAFGMTYVEAMLTGVPIVYSIGTGIDGFVDGIEGAIGVDPYSIQSIRDGMLLLIRRQQDFRNWLHLHRETIQSRFDSDARLRDYNADIRSIRAGQQTGPEPNQHAAFAHTPSVPSGL